MLTLSRAALLLGLSLAWACASNSGVSQQPKPTPFSDFPVAYATAICDAIGSCCGQSQAFNHSQCVTDTTSEGQHVRDVGVTTATYNEAKAAACIGQVRSILSQCNLPSNFKSQVSNACEWIYDGSSPIGGSCNVDQDCVAVANGLPRCYQTATDGRIIGQCVSDTPGHAGDVCGSAPDPSAPLATHTQCVSDLYCDATMHCAATTPQGGACAGGGRCAASLYCEPSTGQCQPTLAVGAPCSVGPTMDNPCGSGYCNLGTCSARPTSSICAM